MWCGNYGIDPDRASVAALAALTELGLPVRGEGVLHHGYFIDTRMPENLEARVFIMPLGRHGEATRVGVRITGFGTHAEVCARLLDAIARHIDGVRQLPPAPVEPVPPPPAVMLGSPPVTTAPQAPRPAEPSLPSQPIPVK
jgi:hypothetical protein